MLSRRHFLVHSALGLGAALAGHVAPASAQAGVRAGAPPDHPTPRVGITGAKVLTAEQLTRSQHLVPLFDGIRAIPQIADGIRCHCGCAVLNDHYSLLSCYEGDAMARACPICQGEGRVVVRMHKEGKLLSEIRTAIDAQFG